MQKVYVLIADWDWEGQDPLAVYTSQSKAEEAAKTANDYNDLRPRNPNLCGDFDYESWHANHPFPEGARCWKFVVKEVPLDADESA